MDFSIAILKENETRTIGFDSNNNFEDHGSKGKGRLDQVESFSLQSPDSIPIPSSKSIFSQQPRLSLPLPHQDQQEVFRSKIHYTSINLPPIPSLESLHPLPPLTPLPPLPQRFQSPSYRLHIPGKSSTQQSQPLDLLSKNHDLIDHSDRQRQDLTQEPKQSRLLSWDQFHQESQQQPRNPHQNQQNPFLTDWRHSSQAQDNQGNGDTQNAQMSSEDINEALLQSLDPKHSFFDDTAADTSRLKPRPAPCYPASSVLSSLLVTLTSRVSSTHFHWQKNSQRFGWAGTVERENRRNALQATKKGKDKDQETDLPLLPWKGSERIRGYSQSTSDSIIERFLKVSTHFRRLELKIGQLRNGEKASCSEAHSLGFSLEVVLSWLGEELRNWSNQVEKSERGAGTVTAWKGLEQSEEILDTLAEMMSCSYEKKPPFKSVPDLSSTSSILSHVHSYLLASISSHSSLLLQAILSYILEHTSKSWRIDVASWIGWPGAKTSKVDFESLLGISDSASTPAASEKSSGGKAEPWAGVEVEWGSDERGEEDLGYVLLPSKLPHFLNTSNARDLLEAGRALRLLKKAATPDHPLLKFGGFRLHTSASGDSDLEKPMAIPGWTWNESDAQIQSDQIEERVKNLGREIAKWRKSKGNTSNIPVTSSDFGSNIELQPNKTELQIVPLNAGLGALKQTLNQEGASGISSLAQMMNLFDSDPGFKDLQPSSTATTEIIQSSNGSNSKSEFLQHLAKILFPLLSSSAHQASRMKNTPSILPDSVASLPVLTKRVFVSPLLQWSSLINSALISVFFRDLGLGVYLETCRQFLLLGSHNFYQTVRETLFDGDGADPEKDREENIETGRRNGIGLSRKLNNCLSWPPNGSELTSTLMNSVVETVSDMRANDARRIAVAEEKGVGINLTGTTVALKDLDERLSFAIGHPERRKGDSKNWKDPQSIEALDWLSLSFFPPPLISPLLTQQASVTYQRIFNFLLRIMRVQSALRGLTLDTFKSSDQKSSSARGKVPARLAEFNLLPFEDDPKSRDLLLRFKHEAQHFHNALGSFVSDIAVTDSWKRFQSRLSQLSKDAEARDASFHGREREQSEQENQDELQDDLHDFDEQDSSDLPKDEGATTFQLKDVFSLARYHERVLEGILQTCFLKARQKGVMRMITDLQQLTLDLALLVRTLKLSSLPSTPAQRSELLQLHRKFYSRFSQFIKTLKLLKDRTSGLAVKNNFEKTRLSTLERNQKEMEAGAFLDPQRATELELERQELETWKDLELLEGKKDGQDKEIVDMLLARLDVLGEHGQK